MGEHYTDTDIAIIGMAARFPGAADPASFWANLRDGIEGIVDLDDDALAAAGIPAPLRDHPAYVKRAPILADIDLFDAGFWGLAPREADILDPQQRLFLTCAWEVFEHAGHVPARFPGRVGVFAGAGVNTYLLHNLLHNRALVESVGEYALMLASDKDYLATRAAFKLGLEGPCINVQTACSTSLVAVHLAVQSLLAGESDMALAGGVAVRVPQAQGHLYSPDMIHSSDGRCRPFDAAADGTVGGSGAGVVLLRRLADARDDGDTVYAVIKGSAVNNDGARKVGYTAPSIQGQAQVIAEAQEVAGVDAGTVTYVEAHGTGTRLGDPIEVAALTRAFRRAGSDTGYCALGSVKSNLGHLDAAAGVAGLMKTALALHHRALPPSLHYQAPNPQIDFAASPFYVQQALARWAPRDGVRRAGVSAFGIGGTNAHVVLAEAPPRAPGEPGWPWQILPLSARTAGALDAMCERLAEHLERSGGGDRNDSSDGNGNGSSNRMDSSSGNGDSDRVDSSDDGLAALADIAHTLQQGRSHFEHRHIVVVRDRAQAVAALRGQDGARGFRGRAPGASLGSGASPSSGETPRVAFLLSGQGAQYPGMGRALYAVAPAFRGWVDECAAHLEPRLGRDLRALLLADPADRDAAEALRDTALTQPALFTIEYALARQWMAWGVQPAALVGHSIGEYAAACLAGIFSLPDALDLVAERGLLMSRLPGGAMMSVAATPAEVQARLPAGVDLAAINAPALCVVAGSADALEDLGRRLAADDIDCRRLHVSHAFHSAQMEPMLDLFAGCVGRVARNPPSIPVVSNVTGAWLTPAEAADPGYWARHVRSTVRFADCLDTLAAGHDQNAQDAQQPPTILLEVGPGQVLSTFARACARVRAPGHAPLILSSLPDARESRDEQATALAATMTSLGRLWTSGVEIDWQAIHPQAPRRRVPLPTYPFEQRRHWIEAGAGTYEVHTADRSGRLPMARWLSRPGWDSLPDAAPPETEEDETAGSAIWFLCARAPAAALALAQALRACGQDVVTCEPDALRAPDGWQQVNGASRVQLVHVLGMEAETDAASERAWNAGAGDIIQLLPTAPGAAITISVVVTRSLALGPTEALCPARAGARGALTVLGQEMPELRTQWIDVAPDHAAWAQATAAELMHGRVPIVALRGYQRFAPRHEPMDLPGVPARASAPGSHGLATQAFREGGVYLITGGTGAIGTALALHLARTYHACVALLGRGTDHLVDAPDPAGAALAQRIHDAGGQAMLLRADVTRAQELTAAVDAVHQRWGRIDGVIHAAGISGGAAVLPCIDTTAAEWARIAEVKELGTRVLAQAIAPYRPPWAVVMGSLSAVLGGLGLAAYASANIAQDALVHQLDRTSATRWYSIAWDGWATDGSGDARTSASPHTDSLPADSAHAGDTIQPGEGIAVLERVLGQRSQTHVVVAVSDLDQRRRRWIDRVWDDDQSPDLGQAERPQLATDYAAPRTPTETTLAAIWSELLGIARVGIHDDFFELGGHSLLATRLAARIRAALEVDMQVRTLFDNPTIAELASHLASHMASHMASHQAAADLARRLSAPPTTNNSDADSDDDDEREEIEL